MYLTWIFSDPLAIIRASHAKLSKLEIKKNGEIM